MLLLSNKVDSENWIKHTCEVEGIENKNKVLNSELLSTIGDWNLDYFNYTVEDNSKIIGYCAGGFHPDNKYLLLGFQVNSEERNKNYGSEFLREIVYYYKNLKANLISDTLVLCTKNPYMKKIALKNGFIFKYKKENSFLNDGSLDDVFELKFK